MNDTLPPDSERETPEAPVSPDAPAVPFWPLSAGLGTDPLDRDFDRQHPDYLESP